MAAALKPGGHLGSLALELELRNLVWPCNLPSWWALRCLREATRIETGPCSCFSTQMSKAKEGWRQPAVKQDHWALESGLTSIMIPFLQVRKVKLEELSLASSPNGLKTIARFSYPVVNPYHKAGLSVTRNAELGTWI